MGWGCPEAGSSRRAAWARPPCLRKGCGRGPPLRTPPRGGGRYHCLSCPRRGRAGGRTQRSPRCPAQGWEWPQVVLGTSVPTDLTTETAQGQGPGACCGWEVRAYFEPGRAAPPCVHRLTWVRGAQLGPCAPQVEGRSGEPWAAGGGRAALGAVGSVGFYSWLWGCWTWARAWPENSPTVTSQAGGPASSLLPRPWRMAGPGPGTLLGGGCGTVTGVPSFCTGWGSSLAQMGKACGLSCATRAALKHSLLSVALRPC